MCVFFLLLHVFQGMKSTVEKKGVMDEGVASARKGSMKEESMSSSWGGKRESSFYEQSYRLGRKKDID